MSAPISTIGVPWRATGRAVAAAALLPAAVLTGPAGLAAAAPPQTTTFTITDTLPCLPDTELFMVTVTSTTRFHERVTDDRYHESSGERWDIHAAPLDCTGSSWRGNLNATHTANDGAAGGGHAVSTVTLRLRLRSSDGEILTYRSLAHITATARPDQDPETLVRVFFHRAACGGELPFQPSQP